MEDYLENLKLIGLKPREIKVMTTLHIFGQLSVTQLGGRAKLPRTTVDAVLRRLHERGLVRRVPKGKRHVWKATNVLKVKNRTDTAFEAIQAQVDPSFVGPVLESIDAKDVGIRVYRGKKQIQAAYIEFFKQTGRMLAFQGKGFIEKYGEAVFAEGPELMMKKEMGKQGIVIEGVVAKSNLEAMQALDVSADFLREVFSVPYKMSVIDDHLLPYPIEVGILGGKCAISIPAKSLYIMIEQADTVAMIKGYLQLLVSQAQLVNTYDLLQSLLEQRGE